jgi:hypothetical protein
MPQREKFGTGSSMPPKVNSNTQLRRISKLVATANIEVLEELSRVESSYVCVLANNAHASYSP